MSLQIFAALVALVTMTVAQSAPDLTVNTPTSVQACLPVALTWTGGASPVFVSLIPGGQPSGPIIKDFGPQSSNQLTWVVDQPAGTSLTIQIRDNIGKVYYSDKFSVQPSSQTCKPGDAAAAGAAAGGATGSSAKPGTPPPAGNTTKPSSSSPASSSTPSGSSSATTAAPPSSGSTNAAATTGNSPASQGASSDASRAIPGFLGLTLVAALAIFA